MSIALKPPLFSACYSVRVNGAGLTAGEDRGPTGWSTSFFQLLPAHGPQLAWGKFRGNLALLMKSPWVLGVKFI